MKRVILLFVIVFAFLSIQKVYLYPERIKSENLPDFSLVDSSLSASDPGVYQLSATIRNDGAPATAGSVPHSWEDIMYDLPLDDGEGTLDESVVASDLNGDGDKDDTFDVKWNPSTNRPWDATIDGTYIYALRELPEERVNRTYYINGDSKLFKLGSETHTLYAASNENAYFGLGNAVIKIHPSPNFMLIVFAKISANNFKINDEVVKTDHIWSGVELGADGSIQNETGYVVPKQASVINTGEEVTFSCTIASYETTSCDVYVVMNWSPDGNIRYIQFPVIEAGVSLEASPETSDSNGTPGYSFVFSWLSIILGVVYTRKRKISLSKQEEK